MASGLWDLVARALGSPLYLFLDDVSQLPKQLVRIACLFESPKQLSDCGAFVHPLFEFRAHPRVKILEFFQLDLECLRDAVQ